MADSLISAVASIGGSAISSAASGNAASAAAAGNQAGLNATNGIYSNLNANYAPYQAAGSQAISQLTGITGGNYVNSSYDPAMIQYAGNFAGAGVNGTAAGNQSEMDWLNATINYDNLQNFYLSPVAEALLGTGFGSAGKTPLQNFQQSPGYSYAVDQGEKATNASAAAAGSINSPNTALALQNNVVGLANQNYGNYQNAVLSAMNSYTGNLQSIAGMGVTTNGQQTQAAGQQSQITAGLDNATGKSNADSQLQQGNTLSSALTNAAGPVMSAIGSLF